MVPEPRASYDCRVKLARCSLCALALACGPVRPAPAPASASAPTLAPTPAPDPAPAPVATPAPAPPPPTVEPPPNPCRPLQLAKACFSPRVHDWLDSEALLAWYRARGAKPPANEVQPTCREIALGPKAEAALLCERIEHETRGVPGKPGHTFRVLALVSVRTVRNARAVTVFEAPTSFDALDKEDLDEGPMLALDVEARSPLLEIELHEPSSGVCDEARQRVRDWDAKARAENDAVMLGWNRLDADLVRRVCAARGTYVWKNGGLRREATAGSTGSSGP